MKKITKKIMTVLLAVVFMFYVGVPQSVYAVNDVLTDEDVYSIAQQLTLLDEGNAIDVELSSFNRLLCGYKIHAYECIEGTLVEADFSFYPLFYDDILICMVQKVVCDNGESYVQLTECFLEEFNNVYQNGEKIALIYDVDSCYFVFANGEREQIGSFTMPVSYRDVLDDTISIESVVFETVKKISSYNAMFIQTQNMNARSTPTYQSASISVDYVTQNPPSKICWAASVACIGNYLTSEDYTAVDVARYVSPENYNQSVNTDVAMRALYNIYGIDYAYFRAYTHLVSEEILYNNLSQGYPIFSVWSDSQNSSSAHAVVIRGILTNSYVMVMDPDFGFTTAWMSDSYYRYVSSLYGTEQIFYYFGSMY